MQVRATLTQICTCTAAGALSVFPCITQHGMQVASLSCVLCCAAAWRAANLVKNGNLLELASLLALAPVVGRPA